MKTAIMLVTAVAAVVALWTVPWWEWWMSIIFILLYNIVFMRSGDSSDTDEEPPAWSCPCGVRHIRVPICRSCGRERSSL